ETFAAVAEAVGAALAAGPRVSNVERTTELLRPRSAAFGARSPGAAGAMVLDTTAAIANAFGSRSDALGRGLVAGLREANVSEQDIQRLLTNLAASGAVNLLTFNTVFSAGALAGAGTSAVESLKSLVEFLDDPAKTLKEMMETMQTLLTEDAAAEAL